MKLKENQMQELMDKKGDAFASRMHSYKSKLYSLISPLFTAGLVSLILAARDCLLGNIGISVVLAIIGIIFLFTYYFELENVEEHIENNFFKIVQK